mmetsp:Transcript_38131/g.92754  ORF Transcript_38131/g.92754 Transcript_38131/m.92754 type:complete len:158 (-) Transcript_38131:410-883(-)|eukprot:CAMPEP_0113457604 /NCGR_PEP_ID=MMETSP0014_2-20120614/9495_1 /TAXON_ID=2857 /ORGANISM="Nitzschia sp." /LENGTH=157 /DNA_ID=CAMNT_0000349107 /DNA_START=269 /DNA_END=742 /DNA_ORIENTATION=+ /assembly_acc=CAM_ASM_000159
MKLAIFLSLFASSAVAFQPSIMTQKHVMTQTATTPTALHLIMSEEETETVLNHARECLDAECPIDEVDDLVNVLKTTESELQGRLEQVMNMISTLQHLNEKEERKTDEVRAFVSDMLRVFNTDKPMVFPTGFSGDVSHGKNTAYDVLPPKKWTNQTP